MSQPVFNEFEKKILALTNNRFNNSNGPSNEEIWHHAHLLYTEIEKNRSGFFKRFSKIVKNNPLASQLHYECIEYLVMKGYSETLEKLFFKRKGYLFKNIYAWYGLSILKQSMGQHIDAISLLEKSISYFPKYPPLYHFLSISLLSKGDEEEAVETAKKALTCDPNNSMKFAEPHFLLATIYFKQGYLMKSKLFFKDFLLLAPPYLGKYRSSAQDNLDLLNLIDFPGKDMV